MDAKKLFKNIITLLLAIAFILPSGTIVNAFSEMGLINRYESDEDIIALERYIYYIYDDYPQFDVEKAIEDNLEGYLIESGKMFNILVDAEYGYNEDRVNPQAQFAYWGNWCGPGYGGGTPIDILDSGCRDHDKCYGKPGYYYKCSCDQTLVNYIKRNKSKMTGGQKIAANGIQLVMNARLSNPSSTGGALSCKR